MTARGGAEPTRRSGDPGRRKQRSPRQPPGGRPRPRVAEGAASSSTGEPALDPAEALDRATLEELQATARPHTAEAVAKALATALTILAEDGPPEAAIHAAQAAKRDAPRSAAVRELLGIALYQAGEYKAARTELAAAQRISGRPDLSALLADIERALGRPEQAIAIFERADRPKMDPDTATELLLVTASAYGDLGRPASGVALIRRHARWPVELADHHLRLAYAEGALAAQAGDLAGARSAFGRVLQVDPEFHDAAERLSSIRSD